MQIKKIIHSSPLLPRPGQPKRAEYAVSGLLAWLIAGSEELPAPNRSLAPGVYVGSWLVELGARVEDFVAVGNYRTNPYSAQLQKS